MENLLDTKEFGITLFEDQRALTWEIRSYLTDKKFQDYLMKVLSFLTEHMCIKGMNDLRKMRAIPPETQTWIETVWMGQMIQAGLTQMANIVPEGRITTGSISATEIDDKIGKELEKVGVKVQFYTDVSEAAKWLGMDLKEIQQA